MKKLNITKEQFEKSRYFKNKYGTLEYVSESGNVFKTNKGKVLKFVKESIVDDEQKWNDELWDCIITVVQSLGDEISSALIDADGNPTYDFVAAVKIARNAVSQEIADEVGEDITFTNELSQFVTPQEYASRIVDYVLENRPTKSIARVLKNKRSKYAESSKKFGKKFNESDLMNDDEEGEPVIDYQVDFVNVVLFAEYLSKPLKIKMYLEGGKCAGASVQKADAKYSTDPWISWKPGKKLKTGGEFYGPTGLFDLAEDRKFKNWLEELVRDIESKYA